MPICCRLYTLFKSHVFKWLSHEAECFLNIGIVQGMFICFRNKNCVKSTSLPEWCSHGLFYWADMCISLVILVIYMDDKIDGRSRGYPIYWVPYTIQTSQMVPSHWFRNRFSCLSTISNASRILLGGDREGRGCNSLSLKFSKKVREIEKVGLLC